MTPFPLAEEASKAHAGSRRADTDPISWWGSGNIDLAIFGNYNLPQVYLGGMGGIPLRMYSVASNWGKKTPPNTKHLNGDLRHHGTCLLIWGWLSGLTMPISSSSLLLNVLASHVCVFIVYKMYHTSTYHALNPMLPKAEKEQKRLFWSPVPPYREEKLSYEHPADISLVRSDYILTPWPITGKRE